MNEPLAWLVDANVISEMMRPRPEPRVAASLDSIASEGLGTTSFTIWVILNGLGQLPPGKRRENLFSLIHDMIGELFEDRTIDWTLADAQECARIMEEKRRGGEPLDDHLPDAMLAAAASRGLGVVTRNVREFRNTGVKVIDPWAARTPTPTRFAPRI